MAKHDARDPKTGRFTPSGAPIPQGEDHAGADPLAYHAPLYDPNHGYPSFGHEYHDPSHGGLQRRIQPRHTITIDGETGQRIAYEVDHEMRGVDTMKGGHLREQAHLQAAGGDPFVSALMSRPDYDFNRQGHQHMMDEPGVNNDEATHHAWPGEVGKPMRERP